MTNGMGFFLWDNAMFATHDWEWFVPAIYGDDWGMVYHCFNRIIYILYIYEYQDIYTIIEIYIYNNNIVIR